MNCRRCKKLMDEYLDKTIPQRLYRGIKEHLNNCEACRILLEDKQRFSNAVHKLLVEKVSSLSAGPDMLNRVQDTLESDNSSLPYRRLRIKFRYHLAWGIRVAVFLLLLTTAYFFFFRPSERAPIAKSYLKCVATIYENKDQSNWIERRLFLRVTDGEDAYMKIIVSKNEKDKY